MAPSFRGRLYRLAATLRPFAGQGANTFHPVRIRPSMGFSLVPKPKPKPDQGDRVRERRHNQSAAALIDQAERLLLAAAGGGPEAQPPGLVEGNESDAKSAAEGRTDEIPGPDSDSANGAQHDPRIHCHGLSKKGARMLEDFCAAVRQDGHNFGFWTVTLSPAAAAALDRTPRGLARFQDTLRRRFGEVLSRKVKKAAAQYRGRLVAHWAFVTENQKRGCPHWHFVFRARARRGKPFFMDQGCVAKIISQSLKTVTGEDLNVDRSSNLGVLRRAPGAYLSKYLRKGEGEGAAAYVLKAGFSENMLPGQWWGIAVVSKRLVDRLTFELPSVLVGWLSKNWPGLVGIGAMTAGIYELPRPGAPAVITGRWHGIQGLERVVESLFGNWWCSYDQARTPAPC